MTLGDGKTAPLNKCFWGLQGSQAIRGLLGRPYTGFGQGLLHESVTSLGFHIPAVKEGIERMISSKAPVCACPCAHTCLPVYIHGVCVCTRSVCVDAFTGFSWLQRTETCSSCFSWSLRTCKLQAAFSRPL